MSIQRFAPWIYKIPLKAQSKVLHLNKKHLHVTIVLFALRLAQSSNKIIRGSYFLIRTPLTVVKIWNVYREDPKNGPFWHVW